MAQVIWKDIVWTAEDRALGIKELLTILKGYGPMEVLQFERPNYYKGKISVWLDEKGVKHITLYNLEVLGEKRKGMGRQALRHLHNIFGGDVHAQDPGDTTTPDELTGGIHVRQPNQESALFWIRMFKENLVQSVDGDLMSLDEKSSAEEIKATKRKFTGGQLEPLRTTSVESKSS